MHIAHQRVHQSPASVRHLHASVRSCAPVVPFKLADIGEGIKEVSYYLLLFFWGSDL
jgi:hypothetical protein